MTKKHLITCSVMLVVIIISAFDLSNATDVKQPDLATRATQFALYEPEKPAEDEGNTFSFAEEVLPTQNEKVNKNLNRTLWKHSYSRIQSDILHKKAEMLFPIIEPILDSYGIPNDFKYLPLVESGLKSGTSVKGARGVWQFMPGTARSFGLKVNKNIDERLNLRKATIAACRYLKELHDEFDSWTLAAAAYNNGSVKLARAINKQNEDNYFRMHLNRETGMYVYKLVAMKAIIENPAKYGYDIPDDWKEKLSNHDFLAIN